MKTIKIILLVCIGVASFIVLGLVASDGTPFQANIFSESEEEVVDIKVRKSLLKPVMNDTLSVTEEKLSEVLETKSFRNETSSSLDIPEYLAIEQSEMFGVAQSNLSLGIRKNTAQGSLSVNITYGQPFMDKEGVLEIEKFEDYIATHISFISNNKQCAVSAEIREIDPELQRQLLEPITEYYFSIRAECPDAIADASVTNTLFLENTSEFSHFISLFAQQRGTKISLISGLTTKYFPSLEWNTDQQLDLSDTDFDGLSDEEEEVYGTDPNAFDTDGDGMSDYDEILKGFDPLVAHIS